MELSDHKNSKFPTGYAEIIRRVGDIEPVMYGSTRNYVTGHVTFLSPYISRGIISTKYIMNEVLNRGCNPDQIEKFIQELAWRDYWQQIWISKGDAINQDLKNSVFTFIPNTAETAFYGMIKGIDAHLNQVKIDEILDKISKSGYDTLTKKEKEFLFKQGK